MVPEMEPENFAEMSLHVVHKTTEAAKLNPAAIANCKSAKALFAVTLPDHNSSAEPAIANHAELRLPIRLPNFSTARSDNQPHSGTINTFATNGAEAQKLALVMVMPRTFIRYTKNHVKKIYTGYTRQKWLIISAQIERAARIFRHGTFVDSDAPFFLNLAGP